MLKYVNRLTCSSLLIVTLLYSSKFPVYIFFYLNNFQSLMHVFIIAASPHTHTGSSVFFPCSCPSVSVPSRKRFLHKWPRNHPIRHERPSLFFPYNNLPVGSLLTGITFLHARFQPYLLAPPPIKALTIRAHIVRELAYFLKIFE